MRTSGGSRCNDAGPDARHPMTESREGRPQLAPGAVRAARRAQARRRRVRQRRGLALVVGATVLAIVGVVVVSEGGSAPSRRTSSRPGARVATAALPATRVVAAGRLPAPVQFPAAAAIAGRRVVLLGGLDSSEASTATVTILSGGRSTPGGTLPVAQHDAQAATLSG